MREWNLDSGQAQWVVDQRWNHFPRTLHEEPDLYPATARRHHWSWLGAAAGDTDVAERTGTSTGPFVSSGCGGNALNPMRKIAITPHSAKTVLRVVTTRKNLAESDVHRASFGSARKSTGIGW